MKWMALIMLVVALPTFAVEQYTESECILIKQQVADYKRRLGANSTLYIQSKNSFEKHCQNPLQPSKNKSRTTLQNSNSPKATVTTPAQGVKPSPNNALTQVQSNSPSILWTVLKPLLPIFLMTFFGVFILTAIKKKLLQIKGKIGEQRVIIGLEKHLDSNEYSIINDVTLPLEDGGTTQIDHIVVSRFGIFVIETKNMNGWIFGNANQAKWTQTIHRSKYQFQNPLRQNYKHTKTISTLLDMPHEFFQSLVVFTRNAELKTKMPDNVGHIEDASEFIKSFGREIIDSRLKLSVLRQIENIRLMKCRKTDKKHVTYLRENF